jgi:hypothetical protein
VGIINAAVWLGGSVFFTFAAGQAPFSAAMKQLLGEGNYPYFSGAIAQILIGKYFSLHVICGFIALGHLLAEKVYLGRPMRSATLWLLLALLGFGLVGGWWLQPKLKALHVRKYATNVVQEERDAAAASFRLWHALSQVANVGVLIGLTVYTWRANHPPDPTRFVSPMQFRG